ncbi:conserved Plasmodium protein, unknown function [Plasmodium ovale curtisi]|uniref:Uncharacterized protein n=1 Tax=Plasmodium ovale curtisi TaxID=864141 RepID=A0A1A8WR98_PLAOA|nr:conserved Plasmodium protein, unknown function [Plasmodium ovale curtisi]SBS95424.1 conserved Plasmodium protein, unknown function [Plasmodium ovale curtisi]
MMDLTIFESDKNLSLNGINKIVEAVYNDNLNFLIKKNKNELERKEIDQFSYKIEALLNSLDGEGVRLYEEKDKMKETFQTIGSSKAFSTQPFFHLRVCVNSEMAKDTSKFFEAIKRDIDNL